MQRVGPVHLLAAAVLAVTGVAIGGGVDVAASVDIDPTPNVVVAGDDTIAFFDLAHNPERDEYLAVWEDGFAPFVVPGSSTGAVVAQRLSSAGDPLGDAFVVAAGPPGSEGATARSLVPPKVAYNTATDQYLVVFGRTSNDLDGRSITTIGRLVSDEGALVGSEAALNVPHGNFRFCRAMFPEVVADPGTGGYALAYTLSWATTSQNPAWTCEGLGPTDTRTITQALDGSLGRGARVNFPTVNANGRSFANIGHNPVSGQIMVTQPFAGPRASEGRHARQFEAMLYTSALTPVGSMHTVDVDPTDDSISAPIEEAVPVADPESGNWFVVSDGSVRGTIWSNLLDATGQDVRPGRPIGPGGVNKVSAVGDDRFVVSSFGGVIHQLRADGTIIDRQAGLGGNAADQMVALASTNGTGVGIGRNVTDVAAVGFRVVAPGVLPVAPARLLETRTNDGLTTVDGASLGEGPVAGGQVKVLQVAGRGGVPVDARAVNLNVTAAGASSIGFVTVFPCDADQPNTSNLNYAAGGAASAAAFARLSAAGTVCLFTSATAHLIVDVNGFVPQGGSVEPLVPARLLDSRPAGETEDGVSQREGRVGAGSTTTLQVADRGGVAGDADAVIVNVTAVNPSANTFLTVFPCDEDQPGASNLNAAAGANVNNLVLAKVSAAGTICVFSSAETHLLVDVAAYVPAGGGLLSIVPARLMETRAGSETVDGQSESTSPVTAESTTELQVAGRGGVDADATGAVLNVAAIRPDSGGFITAYPCDEDRPQASNVNFAAGAVVSNAVVVKLSTSGDVCLYTTSGTDLAVDVVGYSIDQ